LRILSFTLVFDDLESLEGKGEAAVPIALIINNIDGTNLRGKTAQIALSTLAACPRLHLLASVDHINAPLSKWSKVDPAHCDKSASLAFSSLTLVCNLSSHFTVHATFAVWDQARLARYNFIWVAATTYEHYTAETSYSDAFMMRSNTISVGGASA
jgi:origin recognition complex subunit 2